MLGFDVFGSNGIAGSPPDPENTHQRTIFRLLVNIEKDAINTRSLSIKQVSYRVAQPLGSEMSGQRAGISSSVWIVAKRFYSHFSARTGETSRICSKAA